jgi:hypothetical protein
MGDDMQRLLGYIIASMISAVGWKLGMLLGPVPAFFVALIFAAVGLYYARRWLDTVLG